MTDDRERFKRAGLALSAELKAGLKSPLPLDYVEGLKRQGKQYQRFAFPRTTQQICDRISAVRQEKKKIAAQQRKLAERRQMLMKQQAALEVQLAKAMGISPREPALSPTLAAAEPEVKRRRRSYHSWRPKPPRLVRRRRKRPSDRLEKPRGGTERAVYDAMEADPPRKGEERYAEKLHERLSLPVRLKTVQNTVARYRKYFEI